MVITVTAALFVVNIMIGSPYWRFNAFINLGEEANFPTWLSSLLLALAALLSYQCAVRVRGESTLRYYYFLCFSFVFLFFSCDETVQIHEQVQAILSHTVFEGESKVIRHLVVKGIALGVFAGFVGVTYSLFKKQKTFIAYIAFGFVFFVLGAVIIDFFDIFKSLVENRVFSVAKTALEEYCEMAGIVLIITGFDGYRRTLKGLK